MSEDKQRAELAMAAHEMGPVVSPSVPYIKYIMDDDNKPKEIPELLRAAVYDKELALTNLDPGEILWLRMQLQRAEIAFKAGRPALAGNWDEEIMLSVLPAKMLVKLARSKDGGPNTRNERAMQTMQMQIKQASISGGQGQEKKRWSFFGLRK